jgi:integrase
MPRIKITDEYSLVKRSGSDNYYLQWQEGGKKQRRSTGTGDVAAAKLAARDIILREGQIVDQKPNDVLVSIVVDRYLAQHAGKLASKSSAQAMVKLWRAFWAGETVADMKIGKLELFNDWLKAKRLSQNYIRRVVGFGQAALNRAWKRQELTSAPYIPMPPAGEPFPHTATNDQLAKLLNAIGENAHLYTYCLIRLTTGCRGDAALDLQPFQVDYRDNLIRLNPPGRRQTKKYRAIVPLTQTLRAHLTTLPAGSHYVNWKGEPVASIRTTWRKLRVRAELPNWFAPKVMRHTVATELRRRGVPGWEVSGLLGHSGATVRTTDVYAKYDPEYLSKARMALDAWMRDLAVMVPRLRLSAVPVAVSGASAGPVDNRPVFQVVDSTGGQYRDRTCDPYHVKVVLYR